MPSRPVNPARGFLREVGAVGPTLCRPDRELLEHFLSRRDAAAFAELVRRHGRMVRGLALRVLRNEQDAEDVFQATFLALSRQATSLRPRESLGGWLHRVAFRLAQKARIDAARRRKHEGLAAAAEVADPLAQITLREAHEVLDRELARLPDKFRVPLVLCYLEGLTRDEAAHQLGWPPSTLKSRLEQARDRLRARLTGSGLALPGVLVAALFDQATAKGAVLPEALVKTTAAVAAGGGGVPAVSARVAALTEGVLRTMFLAKVKYVTALALALTLVAAGAGVLTRSGLSAGQSGAGTARLRSSLGILPRRVPSRSPKSQPALGQALAVARAIKEDGQQVQALVEISQALIKAGDRQAGLRTYAKALKVVRASSWVTKGVTLTWIGLEVGRHGDRAACRKALRDGLAAAQAVKNAEMRFITLNNIGLRLGQAGDLPAARKAFALALKAVNGTAQRFVDVVQFQAQCGMIRDARKTADRIKDAEILRNASHYVAVALANKGDIQGAQKLARLIGSNPEGAPAVTAPPYAVTQAIAAAQARAGDVKAALKTAGTISFPIEKVNALAAVAEGLAKKKPREALKTLKKAVALVKAGSGNADFEVVGLAARQAELGDKTGALKTAELVKNDGTKAWALARVASALANKDVRAAQGILPSALRLLARIENAPIRGQRSADQQNQCYARTEIVEVQVRAGKFRAALDTARALDERNGKEILLRRIARAQAAAGKVRDARAWIGKLKSPYLKAFALIGVAEGDSRR
jgi:RNA polymerase sigma factor (sigma-70 family)